MSFLRGKKNKREMKEKKVGRMSVHLEQVTHIIHLVPFFEENHVFFCLWLDCTFLRSKYRRPTCYETTREQLRKERMHEMRKEEKKAKHFFVKRKEMRICRCRRKSRDWMIQETNLATTFSLFQLSPSLFFLPSFDSKKQSMMMQEGIEECRKKKRHFNALLGRVNM